MKAVFKSIVNGILYFLTPFAWIIGISIGSVIGVVVFVCYLFYSLFLFVTGRNVLGDLPEDIKVKQIKEQQKQRATAAAAPAPQPQVAPNPYMQAPMYQNPYAPQPNIYPGPVQNPSQNPDQMPQITPDDITYKPNSNPYKKEVNDNDIPF